MAGTSYYLIDADNEIATTYVSAMALWLDEHSDYEWAVCNCNVQIDSTNLYDYGHDEIYRAIEHRYLIVNKRFNRIIGYGALGKNASYFLPRLFGSRYCSTELWDITGNGNLIKLPDFHSLKEDDLHLVFPAKEKFVNKIKEKFKNTKATVYYKRQIEDYIFAK